MIEDLVDIIKEYEECLAVEFEYMSTLGMDEDIEEIEECGRRMEFYQDEIDRCCASIDKLARLN